MNGQKIFLSTLVVFSIMIGYSKNATIAQANNPLAKLVQNTVSPADRRFVIEAAQGGQAEVELGQLALELGFSKEVKQYGQRMVEDHTQANNELKELAAKKNINIPAGIGKENSQIKARLSKLSGKAFDQAYINQMIKDHNHDVSLFQRQSQQGDDPELKAWATKTLPVLEAHLQYAQAIANSQPLPSRL